MDVSEAKRLRTAQSGGENRRTVDAVKPLSARYSTTSHPRECANYLKGRICVYQKTERSRLRLVPVHKR